MKTNVEMVNIVKQKIKLHLECAEYCNDKYCLTGKESWYTQANEFIEKAEMYDQLLYEFTGEHYDEEDE